MAHLWTGQTGVSNSDYWTSSNAQRHEFERKADAIAAEALVPKAEFLMNWNYSVSLDRNISSMTRKFKVSAFVILRSALDLQRVDSDTYQTKLRELWQTHSTVRSSGGNPYANISARNSSTFTVAVVAAAAEGQVSYREAASLLNIAKLSTFYNLEARLLPGD
jgi:Zn-dependent peptidase ImmA (M78 family)